MERVVVTGYGAVSGVGKSVEELAAALRADEGDIPLACESLEDQPGIRISRASVLLVHAVGEALRGGGLRGADREAVGLLVGTVLGPSTIGRRALRKPSAVGLLAVHGFIGALVGNVSIPHELRGRSFTECSLDTAGTDAIAEAWEAIRSGRASVLLAGATEAPIPAFYDPLVQLVEDCPPPSEGAGVLLLESLSHAQRRGAAVVCELCGVGSVDGAMIALGNDPSPDAVARAVDQAVSLCEAPVALAVVSGTGTGVVEDAEREALERISAGLVVRPRRRLGYGYAASGALQAVLAANAFAASSDLQRPQAAAVVSDCGLFGRANALTLQGALHDGGAGGTA